MEIREEKQGDVTIFGLRGRLDANSSPALEKRIQAILDRGENRLVFDFSEVTYISSLGLRVLIVAAKNLQKMSGKIALASLADNIHEIFKIAGFTQVFSVCQTLDEAVTYCAG